MCQCSFDDTFDLVRVAGHKHNKCSVSVFFQGKNNFTLN